MPSKDTIKSLEKIKLTQVRCLTWVITLFPLMLVMALHYIFNSRLSTEEETSFKNAILGAVFKNHFQVPQVQKQQNLLISIQAISSLVLLDRLITTN